MNWKLSVLHQVFNKKLCLQICQFPWNSTGRCCARVSDRFSGAAGYSQTLAPAETEPQTAHDHSHPAESLDWYIRLPGGHDHHVLGLLHCCERFPLLKTFTAFLSAVSFLCETVMKNGDMDIKTEFNLLGFLLFFSQTWCTGGSYTPIGLCWMLLKPWSACSLGFLTTMR